MTAPQVGDTVAASFRPSWENKDGANHTVVGVVWQEPFPPRNLMVGYCALAGAVSVDVVEHAE